MMGFMNPIILMSHAGPSSVLCACNNLLLFLQYDGSSGLWEDEETRIFYENLRDLKAFLPGVMLLQLVMEVLNVAYPMP